MDGWTGHGDAQGSPALMLTLTAGGVRLGYEPAGSNTEYGGRTGEVEVNKINVLGFFGLDRFELQSPLSRRLVF